MPPAPTPLVARTAPAADTAHAIAIALVEGFDKHYALFRECARAARRHFEAGNWLAIQHVGRDRIDFYDRRVLETAERVERECAETFFNSVLVKILHRVYFHNRFIFVRPAISTEYIDADPPSYRSYYPLQTGLRNALVDIVLDFGFEGVQEDDREPLLHRTGSDVCLVHQRVRRLQGARHHCRRRQGGRLLQGDRARFAQYPRRMEGQLRVPQSPGWRNAR